MGDLAHLHSRPSAWLIPQFSANLHQNADKYLHISNNFCKVIKLIKLKNSNQHTISEICATLSLYHSQIPINFRCCRNPSARRSPKNYTQMGCHSQCNSVPFPMHYRVYPRQYTPFNRTFALLSSLRFPLLSHEIMSKPISG